MKYHGQPKDGLFFKKNKSGDRTIFADNWPNRAHFWFPSIDHPYDKANVDFFVTAPAQYGVIANGILSGQSMTEELPSHSIEIVDFLLRVLKLRGETG